MLLVDHMDQVDGRNVGDIASTQGRRLVDAGLGMIAASRAAAGLSGKRIVTGPAAVGLSGRRVVAGWVQGQVREERMIELRQG